MPDKSPEYYLYLACRMAQRHGELPDVALIKAVAEQLGISRAKAIRFINSWESKGWVEVGHNVFSFWLTDSAPEYLEG